MWYKEYTGRWKGVATFLRSVQTKDFAEMVKNILGYIGWRLMRLMVSWLYQVKVRGAIRRVWLYIELMLQVRGL